MFKVPNQYRNRTHPVFGSDESLGLAGLFVFERDNITFQVIAADGMESGWEHVSVSLNKQRVPTWDEMCIVKDLFWDEEDCVIQYHPPKSMYINDHPYVLHLWRKVNFDMPVPPVILVGNPNKLKR